MYSRAVFLTIAFNQVRIWESPRNPDNFLNAFRRACWTISSASSLRLTILMASQSNCGRYRSATSTNSLSLILSRQDGDIGAGELEDTMGRCRAGLVIDACGRLTYRGIWLAVSTVFPLSQRVSQEPDLFEQDLFFHRWMQPLIVKSAIEGYLS